MGERCQVPDLTPFPSSDTFSLVSESPEPEFSATPLDSLIIRRSGEFILFLRGATLPLPVRKTTQCQIVKSEQF